MVCHDLGNPLVAIRNKVTALLQEDLPGAHRKALAIIVADADYTVQLVAKAREFALRREHEAEPTRADCDLHSLVLLTVERLRATAPGVQIHEHVIGRTNVHGDPVRLRQMVENLLTNAHAHGDGGSPIHVTLKGEADGVLLSIKNRGAPIPADVLPVIFNPVERRKRWAKGSSKPAGLGLGLYIVKQVAEGHGGRVSIESSTDGTTVTVRLPLSVL